MWITLLVMAVAVSLEPFRIGMTVLMLNRPGPALQLMTFLAGGFAMGTAVGLVVLFVLRHTLSGAAHFTLPRVQIVIGVLALLVAAVVIATPFPARGMATLSTRARHLMGGSSLWVAGAAGLGIALPSVDYLAALAVIIASGAAPATQVAALLTFNVVAFTLVEIPLVAYLAAPDKTRALMAALNNWIRSHRRRNVAVVLAAVGSVLLAVGIAGL
jgi:Sap, sulfolipid-1-addressing protein